MNYMTEIEEDMWELFFNQSLFSTLLIYLFLIPEKRAQYVENTEETNGDLQSTNEYPSHPPPPVPPAFAKIQIYQDPDEFAEVDSRAISVAQEDQKTFTGRTNFSKKIFGSLFSKI